MGCETCSHEEVLKKYSGIISILRYLSATSQFSYVDRLSASMSLDEVRAVILEALRTVRSALDSAIIIEATDDKVYRCCDIEESVAEIPPYAYGIATKIRVKNIRGVSRPEEMIGKEILCYRCPTLPSDKEIAEFLDKVSKDLDIAKTIAAYALTRVGRT